MDAIAILFIAVFIGFLPTFIAASKHRENVGAIFALNLLLGWTGIGWICALIWALTNTPKVRS